MEGAITSGADKTSLQVTLTGGEVQGRKVAKRGYKVNGVGRRKSDFVGKLTVALFRPEDLEIITDSPTLRREFLDGVLTQVDREYRRSLVSYEKGLRRRNKLLTLIRDGEIPRSTLAFWDQLLVKEGTVLTGKRRELIEFINLQPMIENRRWLQYDFSAISESRLKQYAEEELAAGYTLVGPHRDDFSIFAEELQAENQDNKELGRDLAKYGSRGQQRMAVFWLKLGELAFIETKNDERPVLLLDDIFSELDDQHDRLVMNLVGKQQTIITTTEVDERFEKIEGVEVIEI